MRAPPGPRGFTLVELLVGTAVGTIVLTGICLVFVSQASQYQAHASRRAVQASVRQALGVMERHVRNAGYGVDPDRAILAYDSYDAAGNAPGDGYPDGLTVHARDLYFRRLATTVKPDALHFDRALQRPLRKGEILLVLCPGAIQYAYVTVGETTGATDTSVKLDTTPAPPVDSPVGPPGALFREQAKMIDDCFHDGEPPVVVKVERTSFYVTSFDDDGIPTTPGATPYLMQHRGMDSNGDGRIDAADATPIAVGIEQLQVAYILNTVGNSAPPIVEVDGAVPWGETWNTGVHESKRPRLDDAYASLRRLQSHPANIRQVRLTLVARSTQPDRQRPGDDVLTPGAAGTEGAIPSGPLSWRQLENLGTTPAKAFDPRGGGFTRAVLREAIAPKNLLMRSQFIPIHQGGS